jgi:hypothetical protein
MERIDLGDGLSVLDGGALVMGSAIASVHILRAMRTDLSGAGWLMMAVTFTWVAITAAGPFVYLARRFVRRLSHYPKTGDRLWAILGVPWLASAILQSAAPSTESRPNTFFTMTLSVGLGIACMIALAVIWNTWVIVSPAQAARIEAAPWTNRVGLVLSIFWPIQWGVALIVLS